MLCRAKCNILSFLFRGQRSLAQLLTGACTPGSAAARPACSIRAGGGCEALACCYRSLAFASHFRLCGLVAATAAAEEEEPDTAGEDNMDGDNDDDSDASDAHEDEADEEEEEEDDDDDDEVEEVEGATESKGKGGGKGGSGTVAGALMAGAKRAKNAPPPKKKVKVS